MLQVRVHHTAIFKEEKYQMDAREEEAEMERVARKLVDNEVIRPW